MSWASPSGTIPALITGVLFEVVAVQLLSFGLLGELLVYLITTRGAMARYQQLKSFKNERFPSRVGFVELLRDSAGKVRRHV